MNKVYLVICIVGFVWASSAVGAVLNVPAQYPTIQAGIDAASDGDTVLVAAGTYTENLVWEGKSIALIGAGADVTTINGNKSGSCLVMRNVPESARIEGFTLTGGSAESGAGLCLDCSCPTVTKNTIRANWSTGASWDTGGGGGVCLWYSSPTLTENTISDNIALYWGGGLKLWHSSPALTRNTVSGNLACTAGGGVMLCDGSCATLLDSTICNNVAYCGGGLCSDRSSPALTNNSVSHNWACYGGALHFQGGAPVLTSNTISDNSAQYDGGGVYLTLQSSPTLVNNILSSNSAGRNGGGILFNINNSATLTNCTFSANLAPNGSALACVSYGQPYPSNLQVTNCILWDGANEILNNDNSAIRITYSDVQGGWSGASNINADPLFGDPANGDYHLVAGSPCIDAGTNDAPSLPDTDKDGNPRIVGAAVDMGAYEWQGPKVIPVAIDIKAGSYPNAVNLGSYGLIPVAILSSDQFDATTVDPETVELAGAGVAVRGKSNKYMAHQEDVNGDGLVDLVVQVATENLSPEWLQDGFAVLTGKTFDGVPIEGKDKITIVPPEK